jgi:Flp pilus assembly pilin Flp
MVVNKGNSIAQYGIIIALVALVLVPGFYLLGDNIFNYFATFNDYMKKGNTTSLTASADSQTSVNNQNPASLLPEEADNNSYSSAAGEGNNSVQEVSCVDNICSFDYGDYSITNIPEDLPALIQTTGASGATDTLNDQLSLLAKVIEEKASENPDDKALSDLSRLAQTLADQGYLIADSEEWVEYGAMRVDSEEPLRVPEDNRLCDSILRGFYESGSGLCLDQRVTKTDFLINNKESLTKSISSLTDDFNRTKSQLSELSQGQDESIIQIVSTIDILAGSIIEISDNVFNTLSTIEPGNVNIESIKNNVASQTTDVKSKLIEGKGKNIVSAEKGK